MKKLLTVLAMAVSVMSFGQSRFGVHANGILASQTISASGLTITSDSRFSYKVGLIGDIPISQQFSFMPQLNFVNKGGTFNLDDGSGGVLKLEASLNYLELPLNFAYKSKGFFFGAGPVIAYGISGSESADGVSIDVAFDGDATPNDTKSHYKALDIGANIFAGYELSSGLFFNLHYNFGLSNVTPSEEATQKNRYFGFGIGYFFARMR